MKTTSLKSLIVLAKVEMTGTRETGKMVKRDMNLFPEVEAAPEAKALVFSSNIDDLGRAKLFAAQDGWVCWVMDDEPTVLQKARDRVLSNMPDQGRLENA